MKTKNLELPPLFVFCGLHCAKALSAPQSLEGVDTAAALLLQLLSFSSYLRTGAFVGLSLSTGWKQN